MVIAFSGNSIPPVVFLRQFVAVFFPQFVIVLFCNLPRQLVLELLESSRVGWVTLGIVNYCLSLSKSCTRWQWDERASDSTPIAAQSPNLGSSRCGSRDQRTTAEHFVKGKRQNQLTPEHIGKIIDT